jgi:hypothetical protein
MGGDGRNTRGLSSPNSHVVLIAFRQHKYQWFAIDFGSFSRKNLSNRSFFPPQPFAARFCSSFEAFWRNLESV